MKKEKNICWRKIWNWNWERKYKI